MVKKTDNHNPKAKLDLRRYFLSKYHAGRPLRVLDCCQGSGLIWRRLRQEFEVERYWGLDMKPKKGRLSIDSSRVLAQAGLDYDVIDIDTYGSPWRHWEALLPNICQPVTVFLTVGQWQMGTANEIKQALGVADLPIPPGIGRKMQPLAVRYCLARCYDLAIIPLEAVEASAAASRARYIGIRLEPQNHEQPGVHPGCPEQTIPVKEESNV